MSQKNVRPTWCTHFFDPQLDEFRGSLDPQSKKNAQSTFDNNTNQHQTMIQLTPQPLPLRNITYSLARKCLI